MKIFLILFLTLLFFGVFSFLTSEYNLDKLPDCNNENCGKVVGYIMDAVTKERVNIEYLLAFCDCSMTDKVKIWGGEYVIYIISIQKGKFSVNIPEGKYCLQFFSDKTYNNEYSPDPIPSLNPEHSQMITVKKGQVTTVKKVVKQGGKLKIVLVDKNNIKINPKEFFNDKINIHAYLSSDRVSPLFSAYYGNSDRLNDGELLQRCLFPETYTLFLEFENMGYGSQWVKNIKIERDKVIEVRLLIDKADKTGIEGKITDQNGNPLEDVWVSADSHEKFKFFRNYGKTRTDGNGYYKIIGLKENKYDLSIYPIVNNERIRKKFEGIIIRKNIVSKKNIIVNNSN